MTRSANNRPAGARRALPGSPFTAQREAAALARSQNFTVDDRVTHDRHGIGRVVVVEDDACVVDFGTTRRRVQLAAGKLHKL